MSKPIIAVVGRPNVGKSTLFNKLIGERRSIVEDTPGVTRDRIYGETEWNGRQLVLIDTGGIEPKTDDIILSQMKVQAQVAIDDADVIVFMCDVRTGLTAADRDIAVMLQKSGKPIIPCINKCDSVGQLPFEYYEFYELGFECDPVAVSSVHGSGTGDLLDACCDALSDWEEGEEVRVYEEDIDSTDVNYLHIEVSNTYDECCEVVKTPIDSFIVTLDSNLYFVVEDDEYCWDEIAIDDLAKLLDYLESKFM